MTDYEAREELRRTLSREIDWLARRWTGKGEGAWGDMLDQSLFLAREHARLFSSEFGANREHHLIYALKSVLRLLAAALERASEVR